MREPGRDSGEHLPKGAAVSLADKVRERLAMTAKESGRPGAGNQRQRVDRDNPPGAVSDQNGEEGPSELREDQTHPEPRTRTD
jgi:hypothetical protein